MGYHQRLETLTQGVRELRQPFQEYAVVDRISHEHQMCSMRGSLGLEGVRTIRYHITGAHCQVGDDRCCRALLPMGSWAGLYRFTGFPPTIRVPPSKQNGFFSDFAFLYTAQAN